MYSSRDVSLCTRPVITIQIEMRILSSLRPLPSPRSSDRRTECPSPNTFSGELLPSLFCFLRENKTIALPLPFACAFPDSPVRWRKPRLLPVIPGHPELRCPVLRSENEEVEKKKRLIFLNYPQDTSFLSKEQRTVSERRPTGVSSVAAAHSSTFPLMEPSSSYYLNSPG